MKQVIDGWKAVLAVALKESNERLKRFAEEMLKRIDGMYGTAYSMHNWPYLP